MPALRRQDRDPQDADAHCLLLPELSARAAAPSERQSSQVKSSKSQNGESMPTGVPPGDGAGAAPALGVERRGEGVVPLAFGPTPGRKRPKLVNGGLAPESTGPRRLDGASSD